jgi:ADP-L-glycero-D-manno-heptose 6-epimerase
MFDTYIVTGANGMIGSNMVYYISEKYPDARILCVDDFVDGKRYMKYLSAINHQLMTISEFEEEIRERHGKEILERCGKIAFIHLGAISSQACWRVDEIVDRNVNFTILAALFCRTNGIPFVYASSASVYGNSDNFAEENDINCQPVTAYAYFKKKIDSLFSKLGYFSPSDKCIGLRFFNVYGNNEFHKADQVSPFYRAFKQAITLGQIDTFKGDTGFGVDALDTTRDFVYVKDVCKAIDLFSNMLEENSQYPSGIFSGIYNIGTTRPIKFVDVANIVKSFFASKGVDVAVNFKDLPDSLYKNVQVKTCADMTKFKYFTEIDPLEFFRSAEDAGMEYLSFLWDRYLDGTMSFLDPEVKNSKRNFVSPHNKH